MKSKIILLIAGVAVVTLSFTFASSSNDGQKKEIATEQRSSSAPAGGFALEEK